MLPRMWFAQRYIGRQSTRIFSPVTQHNMMRDATAWNHGAQATQPLP